MCDHNSSACLIGYFHTIHLDHYPCITPIEKMIIFFYVHIHVYDEPMESNMYLHLSAHSYNLGLPKQHFPNPNCL